MVSQAIRSQTAPYFDIQALTTEELEAEVQTRMAQRDVVAAEDCPSIVEEEISLLDFLPDNE